MDTQSAAPERGHIFHCLDLIRGLLCLLVVYWHVNGYLLLDAASTTLPFAVDAFFVLSGFVVAHAYLPKLEQGLGAGRLMLIRLIRFYPLFLLGLGIGAVRFLGDVLFGDGSVNAVDLAAMIPQFFFLPALPSDDDILFPLNPPAWSLFAEIAINVAFALSWRRWGPRTLGLVLALGAVALVAALLASGGQETGWRWSTFLGLVARVCFGFPAGVFLYWLYRRGWRAPALPSALIVTALAVVMLGVRPPEEWLVVWHSAFVVGVCTLVVWLGASAVSGPWTRAAGSFFGRVSFAIYALHFPLIGLVLGVDAKLLNWAPAHPGWAVSILIVLTVLVAWAADAWWDRPVTRALRKRLLTPAKPGAMPASRAIDDAGASP